jgi:RNA polymerase sigma factor (TIGR02999 family)
MRFFLTDSLIAVVLGRLSDETHEGQIQENLTMSGDTRQVTQLLHEWRGGNAQALDELMPVVYEELRRIAGRCLMQERPGHTLRATALVHEAYMRLVDADIDWADRVHFYAVAARVLRRVLVEYARSHNRQKRGAGAEMVPVDEAMVVSPQASSIVVDLDEALSRLAIHDQRKSDIVQLLFFGGMTYDETAAALDISPATVHRELKLAKAWLSRELSQDSAL